MQCQRSLKKESDFVLDSVQGTWKPLSKKNRTRVALIWRKSIMYVTSRTVRLRVCTVVWWTETICSQMSARARINRWPVHSCKTMHFFVHSVIWIIVSPKTSMHRAQRIKWRVNKKSCHIMNPLYGCVWQSKKWEWTSWVPFEWYTLQMDKLLGKPRLTFA